MKWNKKLTFLSKQVWTMTIIKQQINKPALRRTIWSSCESFMKPGTIFANSMICWMTDVSFAAHSSQSCSCDMFWNNTTRLTSCGLRKPSRIASLWRRHVLAWASVIVFDSNSLICEGSTKEKSPSIQRHVAFRANTSHRSHNFLHICHKCSRRFVD